MILNYQKPYTKYTKPPGESDIVDFVYESRACEKLFERLRALGVDLFTEDEGLGFDAPDGVLTDDLMEEMRAHRDDLLAMLSAQVYPIPGVFCPFCRGDEFIDEPSGWRCVKCNRLAWGWLGGSFVRADFIFVEL